MHKHLCIYAHQEWAAPDYVNSERNSMATSPTLRTIGIGLFALAALVLATYLVTPPAERVSAQDGGTPTTAGELVVVPSEVEVGQTTLAVGFHVVPRDLEVVIEYSEHFTPEGESCDNAGTAGATQAAAAPTWITLNACTVGKGYVRLVESATGNVIKDVSVTVAPPGATRQQAVTVTIDGLASEKLVPGGSGDRFSVSAAGLESHREHNLHTVVLNNLSAAFNRGCTTFRESDSIVGHSSATEHHTVYGCVAPGNYVWSYVEEVGGTTLAHSGVENNPVNVADPTVSFERSSYEVDEGDDVDVTVELSHPSSNFISIPITVRSGRAESTDVVGGLPVTKTRTFSDLSTSQSFPIETNQDTDRDDETVNLSFGTLPDTVSGTGTHSSATVTILDDEDVSVSFEHSSYTVDEGSYIGIEVQLNGRRSQELQIPIEISDDAESGDYSVDGLDDDILTFSAWHEDATFWIDTEVDVDGDDETVDLEFGDLSSGVRKGSPSRATVTIDEPSPIEVEFSSSEYTVSEGSARTVTVSLSRASSHRLDIPITVTRGRAESNDYRVVGLSSGNLRIDEGDTSAEFTIQARQDTDRDDETVDIEFGDLPSGVTEGSPSSATVTILDDEDVSTSFEHSSYTLTEGANITVTVELNGQRSQHLDVPITVTSDRAESRDYRVNGLTGGRLRFDAWETSETFTIAALQDTDRDDETVDIEFGDLPSGVTEGSPSSATVTILDDEDVSTSFEHSSYTLTEGANITVTVELVGQRSQHLDIPITVTRDRAESRDYRVNGLTGGRLRFDAWETSETFTIAALQDTDRDDETVDIEFGDLPSGVVEGSPSSATVTILDDEDVSASFEHSTYTLTEGANISVTVELVGQSSHRVLIPIEISDDAEIGDYDVVGLTNDRLTFDAWDVSATFTIRTNADVDVDDETVNLSFGTLPSGVAAGATPSATVTIEEDVAASFGLSSYCVAEGSDATVTVDLGRASSQDLAIPITVRRGSAESMDYSVVGLSSGNLSFSAGDTSETFTIRTNADVDIDDETVNLSFGTLPSGVAAGATPSATVTIEDDVAASFGLLSYSVGEGSDRTVAVVLSKARCRPLDIPITVTRDRAEIGDYGVVGLTSGNLRINEGDASAEFTIQARQDVDNDDETVNLSFGTLPTIVVEGSTPGATVNIMDDEDAVVGFEESSYTVSEGSNIDVKVELDGERSHRVLIPIEISDDAETGDYDVVGLTNDRLTFGAWETSAMFTIRTNPDVDNDDETVNLGFGALPSGVATGTPSSATITIAETNVPPTFVEGAAATRLVAENTTSGNDIGNPVSATDDDMDDLTYSLSGTDAGSFRIGSLTGQIRTFASLNFEAKNSYSVTVTADDGNGGTATIYVTVNVTNVNEAPVAVPTIANRTIRAGVASLLIDVSHYFSDPDGDTLSYSAVSDPTGVVTTTMVGSTLTLGRVSVGSATITVTAADRLSGQAMTTSQRFTVTVEDLPSVKIAPSDPMNPDIVEGGSVKFTLTASSAPAEKITVNVIISPRGSFLTDTLPPNEIVTVDIEAATKTGEISLKTSDDEIDERDGSVAAIIAVGEGYTIGDPGHATTAILDNDPPTGLRANGDLDSNGNVTLRWNAAGGATGYKFRYAEEVCVPAESRTGREDETTCGLGASPTWNTISAENVTTSGSTVEATLGGLTEMTLYRIQVQEVNVDASKWSGHTLVYPTDSPPGRQTSVATASFDGHQTTNAQGSHEYRYTICEDTIDTAVAWNWGTDEQNDPVRDGKTVSAIAADIEGAIETWETTVRWVSGPENIVSAKPTRSETCPNTGFVKFIPKPHMKMYCRDEDALGCAGRSTIVLRNIPERRVGESEDDLEPTTWNLMENGCSYLHKIMMHEAGHIFGISGREHPSTPQAVMYGSVSGWRVQFCNPQAYDVVAMMANYQSR